MPARSAMARVVTASTPPSSMRTAAASEDPLDGLAAAGLDRLPAAAAGLPGPARRRAVPTVWTGLLAWMRS